MTTLQGILDRLETAVETLEQGRDAEGSLSEQEWKLLEQAEEELTSGRAYTYTLSPEQEAEASSRVGLLQAQLAYMSYEQIREQIREAQAGADIVKLAMLAATAPDPELRALAQRLDTPQTRTANQQTRELVSRIRKAHSRARQLRNMDAYQRAQLAHSLGYNVTWDRVQVSEAPANEQQMEALLASGLYGL